MAEAKGRATLLGAGATFGAGAFRGSRGSRASDLASSNQMSGEELGDVVGAAFDTGAFRGSRDSRASDAASSNQMSGEELGDLVGAAGAAGARPVDGRGIFVGRGCLTSARAEPTAGLWVRPMSRTSAKASHLLWPGAGTRFSGN